MSRRRRRVYSLAFAEDTRPLTRKRSRVIGLRDSLERKAAAVAIVVVGANRLPSMKFQKFKRPPASRRALEQPHKAAFAIITCGNCIQSENNNKIVIFQGQSLRKKRRK